MRSDTPRISVPAVDELEAFSNDFFVSHGVLPFAGAETPPSGDPGAGAAGDAGAATAAPPADGGEGGEAASQPAAPDNNAVMSRMDEVLSTLRTALPAQQQEQAPDPTQAQVDAFMADIFGPEDPGQQQPGQVPGQQLGGQQVQEPSAAEAERLIQEVATRGLDARTREVVGPVVQRLMALEQRYSEGERVRGFTDLAEEYPELTQQESFTRIRGEATNWATELGNPALVREPGFVELVTLATRAAERGPSEITPGQQANGQLESANGARPGSAGGEPPPRFDAIKKAGRPAGVFG